MVVAFDRIVIAVPGLAEATEQYCKLLGMEALPVPRARPQSAWFVLPNTVIELVETVVEPAGIRGIVFGSPTAVDGDSVVENARELDLRLCNGSRTSAVRTAGGVQQASNFRVDHLVLRTADAEDCVALFGEQLGIRLALDKTVPEWGGRMLFFRTGKLTLEIIESTEKKDTHDYFWGIAYQCNDLDAVARQLADRGVTVSEVRAGRKPGSRVATVKSHCLDIPTLLLQPA